MNTAIIMRGIPGSGKSTFARKLAEGRHAVICSTDDFFVKDGIYRREITMLAEYHAQNLQKFIQALAERVPLVICDNCNVRYLHYRDYIRSAEHYDYPVTIITMPHPDPETAAAKNIHGVPLEHIERLLQQWES